MDKKYKIYLHYFDITKLKILEISYFVVIDNKYCTEMAKNVTEAKDDYFFITINNVLISRELPKFNKRDILKPNFEEVEKFIRKGYTIKSCIPEVYEIEYIIQYYYGIEV